MFALRRGRGVPARPVRVVGWCPSNSRAMDGESRSRRGLVRVGDSVPGTVCPQPDGAPGRLGRIEQVSMLAPIVQVL